MAENATVPTHEEIAALPRWARVAFAARCARRVLPLFGYHWPKAPVDHLRAVAKAVSVAEHAAADARADAAAADAYAAADAARAAAAYAAAAAAAYAADAAADAAAYAATNAADAAAAAAAATNAATNAVVRHDFTTLCDSARAKQWTDDTPVSPTVFGPMWPFGVPKDWPTENAGDRLVTTIAPPPNATAEQIADFEVRLFEALNKLALANGGAGLKLDSHGRDVPVTAPVGTGV